MSAAAEVEEEAEPRPLTGLTLGITALALALGTFMQVLDSTIANVSLPTIAGNLGVSSDTSTWVITSFAVANGVAVPLTGWLMGRFGVVRSFVWSVAAFTAASVLCGMAWSLNSLIVFRIIQGAVSGPMIPGSQALLISIFPPNKRATALGIWSVTTLVAPVTGPILGGWICDNYHWSWIFLINLPVGLVCTAISRVNLAARETPTRKLPIDMVGVSLLIVWVGALQVVLDLGKNEDWFNSTTIIIMTVIAVIGFLVWLAWELTDANPAVDLSQFRNRNFTLGTLAFSLGYALFFANVLILPLWLQTQQSYTATWAGLVAAPSGAVAVVLAPFVARISNRIDPRWLATIAFLAFATSYFMRSGFTTEATFFDFTLPLMVQGIAMSVFFVSMLNIQLDGIAPKDIPSATGISNFCRITAGSFAASIITTAWDRREALHQSRLADVVHGGNQAFTAATSGLEGMGVDTVQSAAIVTRKMVQQAYLLATNDLSYICGWLSLAMVAAVWVTRKPQPHGHVLAVE